MKQLQFKNLIFKEYENEIHLILNNQKIGFAIFNDKKEFIHLKNIMIKQEFRNNKYGELLIMFLQLKNKPILLEILYPKVLNFYKRLGFENDGDEYSYSYDNCKISKAYKFKLSKFKNGLKESKEEIKEFEFGFNF